MSTATSVLVCALFLTLVSVRGVGWHDGGPGKNGLHRPGPLRFDQSSGDRTHPTVSVRIYNHAAGATEMLNQAKEEVARAFRETDVPTSMSHVCSEQRYHLAALIQDGMARSTTFARVVDALNHTDVVAYLDLSARMRAGFDGYVLHRVTAAGGLRYVHVIVRTPLVRDRLISTIAHELPHVLEVAESPAQTDDDALKDWFERLDTGSCPEYVRGNRRGRAGAEGRVSRTARALNGANQHRVAVALSNWQLSY